MLSASDAKSRNYSAAIYGLIVAGSIIAAADPRSGERSIVTAALVVMSLVIFWLAHVYSNELGAWSEHGVTPTWASWKRELGRQWPMVGAGTTPVLILACGGFNFVSDAVAVNLALFVCTAELGLAAFVAARRGGAGIRVSILSTAVAVTFGLALILLKTLLH